MGRWSRSRLRGSSGHCSDIDVADCADCNSRTVIRLARSDARRLISHESIWDLDIMIDMLCWTAC